jgi:cytochrome c2
MKLSLRNSIAAALLALPLLIAAGAALDGPGVHFGDPIHGQRLFVDKGCVRCHAVRGAGGRIGPDLGRNKGRSFVDIASMMWNHSGGMGQKMEEFRLTRPAFKGDELSDLISFLYLLNYFDEPGDPRVGKTLFTEKSCIRCHSVAAEGGKVGPALDKIERGVPPLVVAEALWNHGPAMSSAIHEAGLQLPTFEDNEIIDLFAFVRSKGERRGAQQFESPGDPEKGHAIFEQKGCSACHTLFGKEPGVGPDLGLAPLRGSVTQVAGRMWNHWPKMSEAMKNAGMSVPKFEPGELRDVLAYVFIARYEGAPGDASKGRAIFEGKGCSVCHSLDGTTKIGPKLGEVLHGFTPERIAQGMWNHAPEMGKVMKEQQLSWIRLEPGELSDLLAFLALFAAETPSVENK